jgi:hypothetical protein
MRRKYHVKVNGAKSGHAIIGEAMSSLTLGVFCDGIFGFSCRKPDNNQN